METRPEKPDPPKAEEIREDKNPNGGTWLGTFYNVLIVIGIFVATIGTITTITKVADFYYYGQEVGSGRYTSLKRLVEEDSDTYWNPCAAAMSDGILTRAEWKEIRAIEEKKDLLKSKRDLQNMLPVVPKSKSEVDSFEYYQANRLLREPPEDNGEEIVRLIKKAMKDGRITIGEWGEIRVLREIQSFEEEKQKIKEFLNGDKTN